MRQGKQYQRRLGGGRVGKSEGVKGMKARQLASEAAARRMMRRPVRCALLLRITSDHLHLDSVVLVVAFVGGRPVGAVAHHP